MEINSLNSKSVMSISRARMAPKPEIFDTNTINDIHMCKEKKYISKKCKRFVILNNVVRRES